MVWSLFTIWSKSHVNIFIVPGFMTDLVCKQWNRKKTLMDILLDMVYTEAYLETVAKRRDCFRRNTPS